MAIIPHFSIDFVQISLQGTILFEETKGQGIDQENFTPGQGIIFRTLAPGQGSFSDFPAAPPRMFVDQVPPPPKNESACRLSLYSLVLFLSFTSALHHCLNVRI